MTMVYVLIGLIVATWLYMMFLSWRASRGATFEPIEQSLFIQRFTQASRLIRRGWYSVNLEGKHALTWTGTRAQKVFIKVFPKSASAFAPRDELKGLHEGPSSYFLNSISVPKKSTAKRLPRTKKVI